jgi:hypothetical protein
MVNHRKNDTQLSNVEVVTIAVYQLGGMTRPVDSEDVAVRANALAPGRFAWRKYPEQISLQDVRFALENAKRSHCGYVLGDSNAGWMLTEAGVLFARRNGRRIKTEQPVRDRGTPAEKKWRRRERERMLASDAYVKMREKRGDQVTAHEAHSFFRIDEYVNPAARDRKISRLVNVFRNDPEVGPVVVELAKRVKAGVKSNAK